MQLLSATVAAICKSRFNVDKHKLYPCCKMAESEVAAPVAEVDFSFDINEIEAAFQPVNVQLSSCKCKVVHEHRK